MGSFQGCSVPGSPDTWSSILLVLLLVVSHRPPTGLCRETRSDKCLERLFRVVDRRVLFSRSSEKTDGAARSMHACGSRLGLTLSSCVGGVLDVCRILQGGFSSGRNRQLQRRLNGYTRLRQLPAAVSKSSFSVCPGSRRQGKLRRFFLSPSDQCLAVCGIMRAAC